MTKKSSPSEALAKIAKENVLSLLGKDFPAFMDNQDKLSHLRDQFHTPDTSEDIDCSIYFCGNSLGLQPKKTKEHLEKVLENWKNNTIDCHFKGFLPAALCDEVVLDDMAAVVGALPQEVAVMNALSVNIHLLLTSFYQPTVKRHKILIEEKAFPSDHYVAVSQIQQRGFNPDESLLFVPTEKGKQTFSMDEVCRIIEEQGESIAVVMLPGIHYFTGQVFDMKRITEAAHRKGCKVGFDLAHAVGNIVLKLHDWNVDFACWCTYKYLNSGAGGIGGAFMHETHKINEFPKLLGWWGHRLDTRFDMSNSLELSTGIAGYRISNPPPALVAGLKASLDIFKQTSMEALAAKSFLLTGYLEMLLLTYFGADKGFEIITPAAGERGCQLSVKFSVPVEEIFKKMAEKGIRCDIRKPSVIRLAPVPMYNTFKDVFTFVNILRSLLPPSA